jgi:inosine-uridine nucleoside N-ribohydrolase
MKKILNKAENLVDEMIEEILAPHPDKLTTITGDLRRITIHYPLQFVRRAAAVLLAFGLILGLLSGCADRASKGKSSASIVPLDGPVQAGEPVMFSLNGTFNDAYWELGDGATAEGPSVSHTYQKPGYYRVVMGSKVGDTFSELSSAIVRVHTPETVQLPQVILDTDARNEIDDQHYIGYGLFSNVDVLGINSIHHGLRPDHGGHAQEQINYGEIHYIIQLSRNSGLLKHRPENQMPLVFHGAKVPLEIPSSGKWQDTKPVKSEASEAILAAARGASPDNPVWVLPVGPCTNIANAILLAREEGLDLKSRIKIVWLGGGPERVNSWSFNGENDPWSVYVTGQSGVEFWIILENPTGASLAIDKRTELGLYPDNKLGKYLEAISNIYSTELTKSLYDLTTISMVIGKHLGKPWLTLVEPSVVLGPDQEYRWQKVDSSTNVNIIREIDAEEMKADFFNTLNGKPTTLTPMGQ